MRYDKLWIPTLLTLLMILTAGWGVAQDAAAVAGEDALLVEEELVLEDALDGELILEEDIPLEEALEEDLGADMDLDLALDALEDGLELPLETNVEESVEELASDVLVDLELEAVAEPVDEALVLDEPVMEEALEALPLDDPIEDVAAGDDLALDLDPLLIEEQKGMDDSGVEALAEEALGTDALDDLLLEPAVEDAPAEDLAMDQPVLEEVALDDLPVVVDAPAVEAWTPEIVAEPVVEDEDDLLGLMSDELDDAVEPAAPETAVVEESLDDLFDDNTIIAEPVPEVIPIPEVVPEPAALLAAREPIDSAVSLMLESEALKRKAYEKHALETVERAEKALEDKQYQQARTFFENTEATLEKLGRRPQDQRLRRRARTGLAETRYRWAVMLYDQRDLEAANQMARSAAVAGHTKAPKLVGLIEAARIKPPPEEPPKDVDRWNQEELKVHEMDMAERLKVGRQYYMTGEFDKATIMFEGILKRDPYNSEAIRMLEKTGGKKFDLASAEFEATRANMLAQLRDTWNPRTYARNEEAVTQDGGPRGPKIGGEESKRMQILKKMEAIMIPEVEFRQAVIHDVIDFLQQASREFDTSDDPEEQKGVNIILNLRQTAQAAAPVDVVDDPFADPVAGGGADQAGGVPLITFSARHISLLEALKIVTKVANLKHRVEGSVVMILPWNAPTGDIIVRTYDVLPTVEERISDIRSQLGADSNRGRDLGDFRAMESSTLDSGGADWKEAFGEMGVQWPDGSSVKYVSAMGKLVVANTPDNLTIFEKILGELNIVPSQIEIEARFVEVGQTDLDSLGLEWMLTDNWELAQKGNGPAAQRIVMAENASTRGFTTGNRYIRDGIQLEGGGTIADDIMTIAGVLTNPELTVVLHALDQKGSTDLLSAPKILTQSGAEATIKVVTEYIYPTDFEVTPITATGGAGAGTSQIIGGVVEPSGFETREVGVILTVLPEVSPEGQMINLTMTPQVVSDPVWKNYGTTFTDPDGNIQQLNMEQPFFFTRSISTSIAIYNDATVVMGGMITEKHDEVDDRIPIIGDIPLLGRLFRSNYERSEKRNLLIFVTARLVDPAGRPLKPVEMTSF